MKRSRSVGAVVKVAETFEGDAKKQVRELKRCVREGYDAGDIPMVGASYYCIAEAGKYAKGNGTAYVIIGF